MQSSIDNTAVHNSIASVEQQVNQKSIPDNASEHSFSDDALLANIANSSNVLQANSPFRPKFNTAFFYATA